MQLRSPVSPGRSGISIFGTFEMLAVWIMLAVVTVMVFITYSRLPLSELYNVSRTGIEGGASRTLTYLNYPVAFIAIALIGLAFARLYAGAGASSILFKVGVGALAVLSLGLTAVAAFPGVLSSDDLDAKLIHVIPAIGVALAALLTIISFRRAGQGASKGWGTGDRIRLGITVVVVFLSLPWILAELGFYIGDVPLLGSIFMSREIPAGETHAAVHLGDHHGLSGAMFLLAGVWLSRLIPQITPSIIRWSLVAYMSLMMVYGSFIAAQDFWLEQFVKRGWTTVEIPSILHPALSPAWGVALLATAALTAILILYSRSEVESAVAPQNLTEQEWHGGSTTVTS
jgi:hypothetical protein